MVEICNLYHATKVQELIEKQIVVSEMNFCNFAVLKWDRQLSYGPLAQTVRASDS